MKRQLTFLSILGAASMLVSTAQADVIGLFDYGCNIDGTTTYRDDGMPGSVDISDLNDTLSDQDSLTVTLDSAGMHSVICVFDYEINEGIGDNSWFDEFGEAVGAPVAGQSWEIDDPVFGDILDNVEAGALDGMNAVPDGLDDDVSFAIGFNFDLAAGETAVVSFFLDVVNSAPGFFLNHRDPLGIIGEGTTTPAPNELYFWGDLNITGGGGGPGPMPVPEPATLGLLGLGLIGLAGMRRRRTPK